MQGSPVGSKEVRIAKAVHWDYTTKMTRQEIAEKLGVEKSTVDYYISQGSQDSDVQRMMDNEAKRVRLTAVRELKRQLIEASSRSQTAEKPVKVWQDSDGNMRVRSVRTDNGELVDREPVPADVEMLPDEQARYMSRKEARDILDQLADFTGAKEPKEISVDQDVSLDEETQEVVRDALRGRRD